MAQFLLIGAFGALGAICRAGLSAWLNPTAAVVGMPWGTIAANLAGCFVLGFLAGLTLSSSRIPQPLRAPLMTGFLGSFTTFSTFSVEVVRLIESGEVGTGIACLLLQVLGGLLLAAAGLAAGRALGGP